ncbi:GntR family transcriptional regulator [Streptomyces sp. B-S-A12]|uniref:GntR family transcriptional regulator n=1 Tax=Streptomyces luteolus TaxID=3043615 RepID=A0ABT6SVH3_9ACTN|nr:GntR family transcriptional regulator [Streptomyces sp. B-S-A12]MDI3418632.1 GntR family transcriptional regulator [Streptomyces sp. B-S-A12]
MVAVHEQSEETWPTRNTDVARAREAYEAMRRGICEGDWRPGRVLSYPVIAEVFGINWETVCYALRLLRRDGLVETRPRLGTRVRVAGETWHPPEKDQAVPHAVWIERKIRERLADGDYPVGTRFPSLAAVAEEFGVSIATVRHGLRPLLAEEYLVTSRYKRAGTLVGQRAGEVARDELLQLAARNKLPAALKAFGESKSLAEWSRDPRCSVSYTVLKTRFVVYGWTLDEALRRPSS